jgi:TPR repeat protein
MKTLATVSFCVGVLFLQGCTGLDGQIYVPAVEPTNLSPVYEESATRSEIEAVLGEPVESRETKEGSISIYIYDRGAEGGFEDPLVKHDGSSGENLLTSVLNSIRTLFLAAPIYWASTPFLYADKVDEQEGYLAIVYSADDTVIKYSVLWSAVPDIDRLIDRENAQLQLKMRAENGDPDAQWKLATSPDPQWERWLCLAAHGGNAEAQHRLGKHYRHGGGGVNADAVTAYLWLSLAESPHERAIVANSMTPDQITEAERLLAEWEPNPAECEIETAATTH